eukprot:TRINITY_DN1724_c8_g1_i1.p1 TRINITY_DN1724_c8_g1~~TRINITY_DN1724_c8_g1_i1.p1  ORF type:complete len:417 (+),score=74.90 TRINITY_DN1724_c8_g1_i1:40-1290(+)
MSEGHESIKPRRVSQAEMLAIWCVLLVIATCGGSLAFRSQHVGVGLWGSSPASQTQTQPTQQETVSKQASGAGFPSPIKFMTVLSGTYRISCQMMAGAVHNRIPMEVIGWHSSEIGVSNFKRKEDKLKKKIPLLYEEIKTLDDNTILMFFDGGDVLWQSGPEAIYQAYLQLVNQQQQVIFSAERNCWIKSLPKETCKDWPQIPGSPNRWLNSGCWIGRLGEVKKLLKHVNEEVEKITFETCPKCGDQALFGRAFREGWNQTIQLDYMNNICQNLILTQNDFCSSPDADGKVRNCVTNSVPALFHFNGNPQNPALRPNVWLEKMWWYGKALPAAATVNINGEDKFLQEICPDLKYTGKLPSGPIPTTKLSLPKRASSSSLAPVAYQTALVCVAGALLILMLVCRGRRKTSRLLPPTE